MPLPSHPNCLARCLVEPPMPHPTSSTLLGGASPLSRAQRNTSSIMSTCACVWSLLLEPSG
eukprot:scaffold207549_cov32-Tisochrysis_lutea.AAC.5